LHPLSAENGPSREKTTEIVSEQGKSREKSGQNLSSKKIVLIFPESVAQSASILLAQIGAYLAPLVRLSSSSAAGSNQSRVSGKGQYSRTHPMQQDPRAFISRLPQVKNRDR
jgi:hypothetical protein